MYIDKIMHTRYVHWQNNVFLRMGGLRVWAFFCLFVFSFLFYFYFFNTGLWAAIRRFLRIYLHFWGADAVKQGAYHS